jgi:hypothetical protein
VTDSVVLHAIAARRPTDFAVVTVMEGLVGAHVGLYYRTDSDGVNRHLELAWHLQLENKPNHPENAFWVEPRLEELALADLAASARLIAKRHQDGLVPYALDPADARPDPDGTLQLNQSLGLTCATFLVLVFRHARIELLDTITWSQDRSAERQREDEDAQRRLVGALQRDYREHAALVEREVGCTRIRAEEVAVASGMTGHPIPFMRAEPQGRLVRAAIGGSSRGAG